LKEHHPGGLLVRTVIVEDDEPYRMYLESLLRYSGDLAFVRSFKTLEALLHEVEHARLTVPVDWNLVLVGVDLGPRDLDSIRSLKEMLPAARVVSLSFRENQEEVLAAVGHGADGFLLKSVPADQLLVELRAACSGGAPLSARAARSVLEADRDGLNPAETADEGEATPCPGLTTREREVLGCLARGRSYKATARELGIGLDTVRTHVRSLYPKLGVHNAAEAVNRGIREKLL
jgi:DNA-binding NarL/FixJ family response regulator